MKTLRDGRFFNKKSQSLLEYSIILTIVGATLMAMQVYMKRGIQAAVKLSADQLGPQQVARISSRVENTVSTTTQAKSGRIRTQVSTGGTQTKDTDITTTSSGTSTSVSTQQQRQEE